jgi:hypothetical protein
MYEVIVDRLKVRMITRNRVLRWDKLRTGLPNEGKYCSVLHCL